MRGFFEWVTGGHTYEYGVVSRTGRHTCRCGAVYKVTTTRTPVPDTDIVTCENCGQIMDSWGRSTGFRAWPQPRISSIASKSPGKPWFCYFNTTRMHIFTHLKKESQGVTGLGVYPDGMVETDGHVGQLLKLLDDLRRRRQHHCRVHDR
jgi:hypothetical protein